MRLVVLTGSGVSAESGVSTFRDKDGVWARHDWREVATPEGFAADPEHVHEFYNARGRRLATVLPNPAHEALVRLESGLAAKGGAFLLVTQNVDDLHERAGSKSLLHMHGELLRARCEACGASRPWTDDLSTATACLGCASRGLMRPDVVWFGETPVFMEEIAAAISRADLFVSIGTSGSVYPAAGFVNEARLRHIPCVELNLEPSENAHCFTDARYGKATEIVPRWVDETLRG